uniref:ATP synthase F0 subunit 8 n=1 Tax=Corallina officinalis TaxID=35170 RepID=A0A343AYW0_COROI|nr:ATP synthase F0 subunit 8 [Corallina officinalis]APX55298.1 ATP synthase F0 subunit 8 [Corallina officinalis]QJF58169.1 ATP synthase F0 subunit 8 [Corallina officinalis]QJF58215.1 ATP synthase F0 subunit 8 [Corallina officinalis]
MPQLDFTIAFPQIFWLFLSFFLLYSIIVHVFLPIFVKSFKARKKLVIANNESFNHLQKQLHLKQTSLITLLNQNIIKIRTTFEKNILPTFTSDTTFDFDLINQKLAKVLYYNTLYCDLNVLDSIPLKPKFLNLRSFNDK